MYYYYLRILADTVVKERIRKLSMPKNQQPPSILLHPTEEKRSRENEVRFESDLDTKLKYKRSVKNLRRAPAMDTLEPDQQQLFLNAHSDAVAYTRERSHR